MLKYKGKIIADAGNGNKSNECNPQIFGICLWPFGQNNSTSSGTGDVKSSELYKKLKNDILKAMK